MTKILQKLTNEDISLEIRINCNLIAHIWMNAHIYLMHYAQCNFGYSWPLILQYTSLKVNWHYSYFKKGKNSALNIMLKSLLSNDIESEIKL